MTTSNPNQGAIGGRFPALRRIGFGGPPKIPFVQQMEWTDCGAACLAMVLGYYGRTVALARVRDELGLARDGVTARNILEAGTRLGLIGRGVKVDIEKLPLLARGSILHWEFNHFVVFDRVKNNTVRIFDPAVGVRDIPLPQFAESFTGVALELTPAPDFRSQKGAGNLSRLRRYARELLSERRVFDRIVIISLLLRGLALVLPLLTSVIVDQVVPRSDYNLLMVAGLAVIMMVGFNAISEVMRAYLLMHLRTVLDVRSTLGFLDHLVKLPFRFFQQRSDGDLMMRLGSNGTVREMVTSKSLAALLDGTFVLLYGAIVFRGQRQARHHRCRAGGAGNPRLRARAREVHAADGGESGAPGQVAELSGPVPGRHRDAQVLRRRAAGGRADGAPAPAAPDAPDAVAAAEPDADAAVGPAAHDGNLRAPSEPAADVPPGATVLATFALDADRLRPADLKLVAQPGRKLLGRRVANPLANLLVGGLTLGAGRVEGRLLSGAGELALQARLPAPPADAPAAWFPPGPDALAVPVTPETLAVVHVRRDLADWWRQRETLMSDESQPGLAKADETIGLLFAGLSPAEDVFGAVDPELALVVDRQRFEAPWPRRPCGCRPSASWRG